MSILDKLVYGMDPQVSFFLYNRLPLFLLLTAGLFLMIYVLVVSIGKATPTPIVSFAALLLAASASFMLLTGTMINFIYSNLFALSAIGQGVSIGVILTLIGLILYFFVK